MSKCAYYGKGFHPERSFMKKKIYMSTQLLRKQNIPLPEGAKKKEGGSSFKDKERVHALVASTIWSPSFIFDYGYSRNMVSTRHVLSSLDDLNGSNILLGDNSKI